MLCLKVIAVDLLSWYEEYRIDMRPSLFASKQSC